MAARARELGRRLPAYVIAHDLTGAFRGADVRRHATARELVADLAQHPGGVHVVEHEDAAEALAAALAVSDAAVANARGGPVVPTVLAIDEAVHADGLSSSHFAPSYKRAVALRRHKALAVLIGTQYPAQVHPQLWALCSRLVLFRIDSERARSALRSNAGLPDATAAQVARLELARGSTPRVEGRHYVVHRRG